MKLRPLSLGFAAIVSAAGTMAAQTTYLTSESFQAQLASSYTETFDGIAGGDLGVNQVVFDDGGPGFSFTASVVNDTLGGMPNATTSPFNWEGSGIRTQAEFEPLNIVFDSPVAGAGGYFFATYRSGTSGTGSATFAPGQSISLTFHLQDMTDVVLNYSPTNFAETYRGLIADEGNAITGLTVLANDVGGPDHFSATSNVTMGTIPEPGTVALGMSVVALGVVLTGRRLRERKG